MTVMPPPRRSAGRRLALHKLRRPARCLRPQHRPAGDPGRRPPGRPARQRRLLPHRPRSPRRVATARGRGRSHLPLPLPLPLQPRGARTMRIVDALSHKKSLTAAYDPASNEQRQARRERQAAQHAHAVVSMLNEISRRELDFSPLGGRMIEHTASPDGDWYTVFGGDPAFSGDDVTKLLRQRGRPTGHVATRIQPRQPPRTRTKTGPQGGNAGSRRRTPPSSSTSNAAKHDDDPSGCTSRDWCRLTFPSTSRTRTAHHGATHSPVTRSRARRGQTASSPSATTTTAKEIGKVERLKNSRRLVGSEIVLDNDQPELERGATRQHRHPDHRELQRHPIPHRGQHRPARGRQRRSNQEPTHAPVHRNHPASRKTTEANTPPASK